MEEGESTAALSSAVEDAKRRCTALIDRLQRINKTRLSASPKATLLRLVKSELNFLHRLSAASRSSTSLSFNIGYLEAVLHVLGQPFVTAVSRVCKPVALSPSHIVYVDIVCSLNRNPVWFIISARNPKHVSWDSGSSDKNKGTLKQKILRLVDAASQSPLCLRPSSVVLFFSNGLHDYVHQKLMDEFGGVDLEMEPFSYDELELEDKWTNVVLGRSFPDACAVEIKVCKDGCPVEEKIMPTSGRINGHVCCNRYNEHSGLNLGTSFFSLVSAMKCWRCCDGDSGELEVGLLKHSLRDVEAKMVNFDTTAMVAIVSGISNGGAKKLLATPESELRGRFKGNYDFVIAQVVSENQNGIHRELSGVISGKQGIICGSVRSEFDELISMCGGPNEKIRAEYFLKFLKVVPDCPSTRLTSLQTTRKLALKNKLVFGTGDYWHAPTVTANMAFVRAVSQTGMSISVIEHRPRALIGD